MTNGFYAIGYVWGILLTTVTADTGNFQFSNSEIIGFFSLVVTPKAFNQFLKLQFYMDGVWNFNKLAFILKIPSILMLMILGHFNCPPQIISHEKNNSIDL